MPANCKPQLIHCRPNEHGDTQQVVLPAAHPASFDLSAQECNNVAQCQQSATEPAAAKAVQKITGSKPVRGEDLVSSEELKVSGCLSLLKL
jgi:hypothetical protein